MPMRGEWVEMPVGSMPAAWAAALIRRLTVLALMGKMRWWGWALGGRMRSRARRA